jgi:pimeloyl-ACP methyl ester carboxylesterase
MPPARPLLLTLLAAAALTAPAGAAGHDPARCRILDVPVALGDGGPRGTIHGRLCTPRGVRPRVVQLLVHGITYTSEYWDWPGHAGRYSYVAAMHRAGYATFAIDRIGVRRSAHPEGARVTFAANVATLRAVARRLRRGSRTWRGYEHVVLVGHSYGSAIGRAVAATSAGIDGLVASAWTNRADRAALGASATCFAPAGGLTGYLTFAPGCRARLFFHRANAERRVLAEDEALKSTVTGAELASVFQADRGADGWSRRVTVPVLAAVGRLDATYCGDGGSDCARARALHAAERPFWAGTRSLTTFVLPRSGHNLNLHRNARRFFAATACWLRRRFPVERPAGRRPLCTPAAARALYPGP